MTKVRMCARHGFVEHRAHLVPRRVVWVTAPAAHKRPDDQFHRLGAAFMVGLAQSLRHCYAMATALDIGAAVEPCAFVAVTTHARLWPLSSGTTV